MGKPAARKGEMNLPEPGHPPTTMVDSCGTVKINGVLATFQGAKASPHQVGTAPPHQGAVVIGSTTVKIEGKGAARMGDMLSCGSQIGSGSGTVIIGG